MSPLSFFGSHILALTYPVVIFAALMHLIGSRQNKANLVTAAQRGTLLAFLLISGAVAALVGAFLTNDFTIQYVSHYSSTTLPFFYKLTGLWAGLDGSILFWTWLVSLFSVMVLFQNREKHPIWMPWINATMMANIFFFLSLILFANNPFTPADPVPAEGTGLNPLLQNIAMVVHPPCLYLGFTGFSVPFAFVIAALVTRRLDAVWIEATRRWVIIAWGFLTIGLVLGGAWAYVELGWGGFWAWDPVENAALLPWLVATAYLHSVMIQKKRGMLMVWNVVLIVLSYMLTIFGTYLTRSGVVQSVHAFSGSKLGPFFIYFLLLVALLSTYLIMTRLEELKSQNMLQSWLSKESAFLLNNVILLVATFAVIWGTLFPTLSEAVTGQRITVGIPFFNRIMAPIGLILLLLMGLGPMISWRRSSGRDVRNNLLWPIAAGLGFGFVSFILGLRQWYALGTVFLGVFVAGTLAIEFQRGMRVMKVQKNLSAFPAFMELLINSNRRYGGYIIHLGVLLVFIGIAGIVFKSEADFSVRPGETFEFKGYTFVYKEPKITESEHRSNLSALVVVMKKGRVLEELWPAKNFYKTSEQPSTEAAIHLSPLEDIYIVIGNFDGETQKTDFRVTVNPLISFVWLGSLIILAGTVIVLLPRIAKTKSASMVGILLVGLGLALAGHPAQAQSTEEVDTTAKHVVSQAVDPGDPFTNRKPDDPVLHRVKGLASKLICQCGGCVRMSLKECTCDFAKKERSVILGLTNQNRSDPEILQTFISKYGMMVLTVPPEKGFFGVGYWMPAFVLLVCLLFVFYIINIWFKRSKAATQKKTLPVDETQDPYAKKLKDEMKEWS